MKSSGWCCRGMGQRGTREENWLIKKGRLFFIKTCYSLLHSALLWKQDSSPAGLHRQVPPGHADSAPKTLKSICLPLRHLLFVLFPFLLLLAVGPLASNRPIGIRRHAPIETRARSPSVKYPWHFPLYIVDCENPQLGIIVSFFFCLKMPPD